ncbi:efflux transporter periplasmic adaptor subunit, partial [Bacillus pseudomycoides]
MLPTTTHRSTKKKKWVIIGVTALIIAIAAVSIFVMQSKKKGETKTDPVSFEKVTERKLNNTKLIS